MSENSNSLVDNLFKTLKERSLSVPEFADLVKIPKDRIYKWKQKGTRPKSEDEKIIKDWLIGKKMDNVPHGTLSGPRDQAISDIASSNKTLAEANKTLADAHKIIARNNEDLIKMVKPKTEPEEGIQLSEPAILKGLLVALAEIGSGKKWSSKKEALRELGRIVNLPDSEKSKSEGIHADEDTNSTV